MTTKTTAKTLTEAQIRYTQNLAGQASDYVQVAICDLALNGEIDVNDYISLDEREARFVAKMTREEAYQHIVDAINIDEV